MKIVCISDIHSMGNRVSLPDGDVLVIAGDLTYRGTVAEVAKFNEWCGDVKGKYTHGIVAIAGNHDFLFEENNKLGREMITNATYLQDEGVTLGGVKFWGSPWQPEFYQWAFNLPRGHLLRMFWDMIPNDTDVLITHGPPYMILDDIFRKGRTKYDDPNLAAGHVGCADLAEAVKRVKPQLHVFGHIHESYGMVEQDGTTFANASTCTYHYDPTNKPIVVEVTPRGEMNITPSS